MTIGAFRWPFHDSKNTSSTEKGIGNSCKIPAVGDHGTPKLAEMVDDMLRIQSG